MRAVRQPDLIPKLFRNLTTSSCSLLILKYDPPKEIMQVRDELMVAPARAHGGLQRQ